MPIFCTPGPGSRWPARPAGGRELLAGLLALRKLLALLALALLALALTGGLVSAGLVAAGGEGVEECHEAAGDQGGEGGEAVGQRRPGVIDGEPDHAADQAQQGDAEEGDD